MFLEQFFQFVLVYAGAGQRGYVLDSAGDVAILDSTSPPLGIDGDLVVPCAAAVELKPGQPIYLSDLPHVDAFAHGGLQRDANYAGTAAAKLGATAISATAAPSGSTRRSLIAGASCSLS